MSKTYRIMEEAQADILDVWAYIAMDNPVAADRVERELYDAFEKLVQNPNMGHKREAITDKPVRFWSVRGYYIVYDPKSSPLSILRILSGYRDLEPLLND